MIDAVLLRLAAAMAHAVPEAGLRIQCRDGRVVEIGDHPAADITTCAFRRAVIAASVAGGPRLDAWIAGVDPAGSLLAVGGGLHLVDTSSGPSVWFATPIDPWTVAEVIGAATTADGSSDATVTIRPDLELSATVVGVSVPPGAEDLVDLAVQAHAICLVAEVEEVLYEGAEP